MANYFVKNGGNDAADGLTDGNAWETETKVETEFGAGTFSAGDTISFKRGDTWNFAARITLDVSVGAIGNHIVVGAYDSGADPVFDGGGGHHGFLSIEEDYITVRDIELTDWFDASCIRVEAVHHIILQNLYVHNMTATSWGSGLRIEDNSKHIWILDCTIDDLQGEGIYFGHDDSIDLVKQCWVHNCTISECSEGIEIKDTVTEIFVTNCTLRNNGKGVAPAVDWGQISLGGRFNVIYNCRIEGTADNNRTGIYSGRYQGGSQTNSGKYNTIERCLFVDCTGDRGAIYASGTASGAGNRITNCTFVDCTDAIYCDAGTAGYVIRNCIFDGISGYAINMQVAEGRYDIDYNDYSDGDADVWFEAGASRDLAAYVQATLGQETNGISTAANFAETGMYTLNVGSGAINAGESAATVYDWNDEYTPAGDVDMGWREYNPQAIRENLGHEYLTFISIHDESAAFGRYTSTVGIGVSVAGNVPTPIQGQRSINIDITSIADRYANRTNLGNLKHFYVGFYINADDLTMAIGSTFSMFLGDATEDVRIRLTWNGAVFRVYAQALNDIAGYDFTSPYDLVAGWNYIEVYWSAAPDSAVNDGQLVLWINDIEKEHVDDIDNDTISIDEFRIGAPSSLHVATSGIFYIDVVRLDWLRHMGVAISTTTYLYAYPLVVVTV